MAKKNSFVMYAKYKTAIDRLDLEQKGRLLDAIFAFQCGDSMPELDLVTDMVFSIMKEDFIHDKEKYNDVCRKRSESAKARWDSYANASKSIQDYQEHTSIGDMKCNDMNCNDMNVICNEDGKPNTSKRIPIKSRKNSFHNFHERSYDYDSLERQILNNQYSQKTM